MKNSPKGYSYLIKPTIYKIISRLFLGITFSLLWNRFINKNQLYTVVGNPLFLVTAILLTMAWFNYLKLDGVSVGMGRRTNKIKDISIHQTKKLIDILDEDFVNYELEKGDETLTSLMANVLAGVCFLMISIIIMYL